MTLNAATGRSNTTLLSSEMMYMLPLFLAITTSGPLYCGRILRFKAFLIAVFQTSTKSPLLKLKLQIVALCSCSNHTAACMHAAITCNCNLCRSNHCFCSAIVQNVIKLVVNRVDIGGGTRYVASLEVLGVFL
jgi:hypothetical protein